MTDIPRWLFEPHAPAYDGTVLVTLIWLGSGQYRPTGPFTFVCTLDTALDLVKR